MFWDTTSTFSNLDNMTEKYAVATKASTRSFLSNSTGIATSEDESTFTRTYTDFIKLFARISISVASSILKSGGNNTDANAAAKSVLDSGYQSSKDGCSLGMALNNAAASVSTSLLALGVDETLATNAALAVFESCLQITGSAPAVNKGILQSQSTFCSNETDHGLNLSLESNQSRYETRSFTRKQKKGNSSSGIQNAYTEKVRTSADPVRLNLKEFMQKMKEAEDLDENVQIAESTLQKERTAVSEVKSLEKSTERARSRNSRQIRNLPSEYSISEDSLSESSKSVSKSPSQILEEEARVNQRNRMRSFLSKRNIKSDFASYKSVASETTFDSALTSVKSTFWIYHDDFSGYDYFCTGVKDISGSPPRTMNTNKNPHRKIEKKKTYEDRTQSSQGTTFLDEYSCGSFSTLETRNTYATTVDDSQATRITSVEQRDVESSVRSSTHRMRSSTQHLSPTKTFDTFYAEDGNGSDDRSSNIRSSATTLKKKSYRRPKSDYTTPFGRRKDPSDR